MIDKSNESPQKLVNEERTNSVQELRKKFESPNPNPILTKNTVKTQENIAKDLTQTVINSDHLVNNNQLQRKMGDEPIMVSRAHRSKSLSDVSKIKSLEQKENELNRKEEALKQQFLQLAQAKLHLTEEKSKIDQANQQATVNIQLARNEQALSLMSAIEEGDSNKLHDRLKRGYDPNVSIETTGDTPLHHAIAIQNVAMVRVLLKGYWKEANPNSVNKRNETALHIAAKKGNKEIIDLLFENEKWPNPKIKSCDGKLAVELLPTNLATSIRAQLIEIFTKQMIRADQLFVDTHAYIAQEIEKLKAQKQRHAEELAREGNIDNRDLLQNSHSKIILIDTITKHINDTALLPEEKDSLLSIITKFRTELSQEIEIRNIKAKVLSPTPKTHLQEQQSIQINYTSDEPKKLKRKNSLNSLNALFKTLAGLKQKNDKSEHMAIEPNSERNDNYGISSKKG